MAFYGVNISAAIKNILVRKKEISKGIKNSKKDIKSALVVQGGGMRGVFSAGSLIALEKLGFSEAFDCIYGASSGAMNAAYFLSQQTSFGTSIYYENINNSKFINLLRVNKIVDIDYLFDEILTKIKPLDTYKVVNSKTPLYFYGTDIETGAATKFTSKSKNILKLLKASCALPVYYNRPVFVKKKGYIDGGISKAIPIEEVIEGGCTDILVLLTHPIKFKKHVGLFEKFLVKKMLSKFNSELYNLYLIGFKNNIYSFDICIGKKRAKRNINIATIVPDDGFNITRLTTNTNLLKNAAIDGSKKLFELFNEKYNMIEILKY